MIQAIFAAITESITAFANCLGQSFTSITSMFITTSGETTTLTTLGIATLITAGVSLVVFAFRFIYRLIRRA